MDRDCSLDVAVTGISARFPGSTDINSWWEALTKGEVLTTRYTPSELLNSGVSETLLTGADYVPIHGHLANADRFDNKFFRINPRDAELMDPQHRLMLEAAWSALEDAGLNCGACPTTGVFASGSGSSYCRAMLTQGPLEYDTLEQVIHGTEPDFIASLIAYKLNLTGPAVAIQTACSSSLVSIHFAVQALLNGDCDQALVVAGGIAFPQAGHLFIPGGIKSASGICRPFDERADGVIEGSGVACVVLQRLNDALNNGIDPYGIILGTAINNDGAIGKAGYFAPSIDGQSAVIQKALYTANVDATTIGYIETHGTGTHVGDPIEWVATSEAYKALGAEPEQIAIGALKANIGHLDAAAGLASLIKTLRVVKEGVIPPVAGFNKLNPLMEVENSPLFVPDQKMKWATNQSRRAGISAFGIGGTNAHIIVEAPCRENTSSVIGSNKDCRPHLLFLSAADPDTLARHTKQFSRCMNENKFDLQDVAYTLANGRALFPERLVVCGKTCKEISENLNKNINVIRGKAHSILRPVIFLFPGQGHQYPGMARPFVEAIPTFLKNLEYCLKEFESTIQDTIRNALLDDTFDTSVLNETQIAQPALFVLEYAVSKSLIDLGISVSAVIGHSLGEITAACLAGILSLSDATRFVTTRGKAMGACPEGAMLAINLSVTEVEALLKDKKYPLHIAAINTHDSCVVSGKYSDIESFQASLDSDIQTKLLGAKRAFHSPFIEPAIQEMEMVLESIRVHRCQIPIALNATGQILETDINFSTQYFLDQARLPVRFSEALIAVKQRFPEAIFVEVGVGRTLSSMAISMNLNAVSLVPNQTICSDMSVLLGIGTLWTLGCPLKYQDLYKIGRRLHLPTYPFFGPKWIAPEATRGLKIQNTKRKQEVLPDISTKDPSLNNTSYESSKPEEVSRILINLWRELLNYHEISEHSDFFELGGDSLLMTSLIRKVNLTFGIQIPPRAMLSARVLNNQAKIIRELVSI